MILFHFTAQRFLAGIAREGLTRGTLITSLEPVRLERGWQWLTKNPSFHQEWARGSGQLPYKTNEVRLMISIPDRDSNLKKWSQIGFLYPEVMKVLNAYGDPENWMLYEGNIPREWVQAISKNPDLFTAEAGA